ncbi:MAG: HEAT repeat domain-containing protein [Pseudomonadota bacterium]
MAPISQDKVDLDPAQAADVARITKIVQAIDRGIRSRRLYAANNPTLIHHQQELLTLLLQYLNESDELPLFVEPFELKSGDATVYQNQSQQESFAFRLFNDGIRSLTFLKGLSEFEVVEFLIALATRQTDKGTDNADAVTVFWEHSFEHIQYTVADSIIEEASAEQKSTAEKVEEILDLGMGMYQGVASLPEENDVYEQFRMTFDPIAVAQIFQDRCVLAPEEIGKIQIDITESDKPERLVLDFTDMILAVLQEERDPKEFERIVGVLGTVIDNGFATARLQIARIIMEHVHAFPARSRFKDDPTLLARMLKTLWPPARVDQMIQSLNQDKVGSAEDLETVVSLIDPTILPRLLKQIDSIADVNRRRAVGRGISRLHKGDLGIFLPMLSSRLPDTVRSGLYILSLMKNDKIVDLLPMLIQSPNQTIRKEAIEVLRNFRTPKAVRILTGLLQDPAEEIRILALRILAGTDDREIARALVDAINRREFKERSLQERKAYFHAAARIAGDDFVPFLKEILSTRNWFQSRELNEMYQCATFGLSLLGTPLAKEILKSAARTGNRTVRKFSEAALRMVERGTAPKGA